MEHKSFEVIYSLKNPEKFVNGAFDRFYDEAKKLGINVSSLIPNLGLEKISREILFIGFNQSESFWEIRDRKVGSYMTTQNSEKFFFEEEGSDYKKFE